MSLHPFCIICLLLICISNKSFIACESDDCFRAAVYQHLPLGNLTSDEPSVIIKRNLDVFERIASIASKEGVQILLYPEDAFLSTQYPRSKVDQIAEQVPDPLLAHHNPCDNPSKYEDKVKTYRLIPDPLLAHHNPCDNPSKYEDKVKTYRLSCLAKTNNLYIVANYVDRVECGTTPDVNSCPTDGLECDTTPDVNCPADGHYLFNTAVAFGPDGALVAKYHKMHLYHEYHYNTPPTPEFIHFDTPFGRMGLFICFDILFRSPGTDLISKYGVQTMLYPTWWVDELPFKSANQVQQGWAFTNQVNLLAANILFRQSVVVGDGRPSKGVLKASIVYSANSGRKRWERRLLPHLHREESQPLKKAKAAVYQHLPLGNLTSDEPSVIIKRNLDVFERITSIASKEGVQILLYPEDAFLSTQYPRSKVDQIAEQVPDPLLAHHNPCDNPSKYEDKVKTYRLTHHNPCDNPSKYEDKVKTYRLSCLAKTNNLYIVANYVDRVECDTTPDVNNCPTDGLECETTPDVNCPADGHYLFNTAVAFGPDGALVAKYHKMQLFHEYHFNTPPTPEFIHFDTPFGRMGLFICFDILFPSPGTDLISKYGVQTMLFPTWWVDELPFKSANQVQQGWAFTNQVNLLAANMLFRQSGSVGSGIYSGQNGPMIVSDISEEKAHILIADIPINSENTGATCLANRYNKRIVIDDLVDSSDYKPFELLILKGSALYRLNDQQNGAQVCNNGFCCQLDYSVQNELSLKDNSYWLIVANRTGHGLSQLRYPLCEEFCGVFLCEDDSCHSFPTKSNESIFNSIKISAKFSTNYVYPSATTNHLKPISTHKWVHQMEASGVTLSLQDIDEPVLSMGLYGRCYDRDPPYRQ
ncbi:unnamed protein product [Oppiella nova]|uniref:CN hydrolase domain-containing protein n=1 Tax=Oppiella nova TaxID=334625 RepID=A0A7R9LJQ4_9ACAR|nr:unnamed protein product [Oppiella nova]CAG2163668.1 unnamed protein product [Oppiella nova]